MTRDKNKTYFQEEYEAVTRVVWGKSVARQLGVVPKPVAAKFFEWASAFLEAWAAKSADATGVS